MLGLRKGRVKRAAVKRALWFLLVAGSVVVLYVWRLGTLTPGLSPAEAAARTATLRIHSITSYPLNAPERLIQYAFQKLGHHGAFWMRAPSVFFAVLFLGLFYLLVRAWFGRVVGTLATIVFATTPWVILLARSATPDVMFLSPIAILFVYSWLKRVKPKYLNLAFLSLIAICAVCLYVPGMIWIIAGAAAFTYKKLRQVLKNTGRIYRYSGPLFGLLLVSPLIRAAINNHSVIKALLLLPRHWPGFIGAAKSAIWAVLALVWRTPYHIPTIIGRLAILDVTLIVLVIFGVYTMWSKARRQSVALLGVIVLGIVSSGINQNLTPLTLALPAVVCLAAAGLRSLYVEWRGIFPNNPIPRALAVMMMVILVALHVLFGIRYSLVAWPHTIATHQAYVIK